MLSSWIHRRLLIEIKLHAYGLTQQETLLLKCFLNKCHYSEAFFTFIVMDFKRFPNLFSSNALLVT